MTSLVRFFALIVMLIATPAAAQITVTPPSQKAFVCADKSDAYKLALRDMMGEPIDISKFVAEGRCAWMPAVYLMTIDRYVDSSGMPSRVVEMMVRGISVWAIASTIPPGTWLISHH